MCDKCDFKKRNCECFKEVGGNYRWFCKYYIIPTLRGDNYYCVSCGHILVKIPKDILSFLNKESNEYLSNMRKGKR